MKACSESFEEMESTGEGRPEEGAREEPLLMLEEARLLGILRPRRVGGLLLESEELLLLSADKGETARSSESLREGEIGVKRSSGAMQVGSCIVW
jgi:hypothetical protein